MCEVKFFLSFPWFRKILDVNKSYKHILIIVFWSEWVSKVSPFFFVISFLVFIDDLVFLVGWYACISCSLAHLG